jgi:hypothetical protein
MISQLLLLLLLLLPVCLLVTVPLPPEENLPDFFSPSQRQTQ